MHIPKKPDHPLTLKRISTQAPEYPGEFTDILRAGESVKRYIFPNIDFSHIFDDPVSEHIQRAVWTVDALELPSQLSGDVIRRTLWIHDLPEIIAQEKIGYDVTSVEKQNNPQLAAQIEEDETRIAREIFSDEDFALYQSFEAAGTYMKHPQSPVSDNLTAEGLVAKMVDGYIEGIGGFNYFMTQWLRSENFDPTLPMPEYDVFTYDFTMGITLLKKLLADASVPSRDLLVRLLRDEHLSYLEAQWSQIDFNLLEPRIYDLYLACIHDPAYAQRSL